MEKRFVGTSKKIYLSVWMYNSVFLKQYFFQIFLTMTIFSISLFCKNDRDS